MYPLSRPPPERTDALEHDLRLPCARLRALATDHRRLRPTLEGQLQCLGVVTHRYANGVTELLEAPYDRGKEQRVRRVVEIDPDSHRSQRIR